MGTTPISVKLGKRRSPLLQGGATPTVRLSETESQLHSGSTTRRERLGSTKGRLGMATSKTWIKRLGAVGFAFFLIKGLVWLGIAAAATAGVASL